MYISFYYYSNSAVGQNCISSKRCNLFWFTIDLIPIHVEVYGSHNILMWSSLFDLNR